MESSDFSIERVPFADVCVGVPRVHTRARRPWVRSRVLNLKPSRPSRHVRVPKATDYRVRVPPPNPRLYARLRSRALFLFAINRFFTAAPYGFMKLISSFQVQLTTQLQQLLETTLVMNSHAFVRDPPVKTCLLRLDAPGFDAYNEEDARQYHEMQQVRLQLGQEFLLEP